MSKELNKVAAAISEKLQAVFVVDPTTSTIPFSAEDYEKILPEGHTMEMEKTVDNYRSNFAAGAVHAAGVVGTRAMAESRAAGGELNIVTLDATVGAKNNLHVQVTGELDLGNGKVEYGNVTAVYTTHGTNGAQVRNAMSIVSELANEALSKKTADAE